MSQPGDVVDETLDAGTAPRRELAVGARLGKYRLDRVLGSGGMGVVWAAHDPDLDRAVALKVLRYEQAGPELRQRLLREARAMAKLKHPNVLTVYEVGTEGDRDYIAMELVEGASLDEWIATKPTQHEIWTALIGAGRGLAAAHRAGLVHRDFKPHNVLRGTDGRVLVTDFGLARDHGDEPKPAPSPRSLEATLPLADNVALDATIDATPTPIVVRPDSDGQQLTRTGALLGTPAYMAPEQFLGAASDPRTDQFAYCVTAWQLLTGERPFRGDTLDELRKAASAGAANVKGDLAGGVRAVLARGLEPDPDRRWPDINTLLAALERGKGRTRRRVQLAVGAVALAAIGVVGVKLATAPGKTDSTCDASPEDEIAKAWSPVARAQLLARFGDAPAAQIVTGELDTFATTWIGAYRKACTGERNTRTFARLGCLLGERDIVMGITAMIPKVPLPIVNRVEMGGVLPRPQACEGDQPVAAPTMPENPELREKIMALRQKLISARWDARAMLPQMPALVKQAEDLGWDPLLAEAHEAWGIAAENTGQWETALAQYRLTFELSRRAHYDRVTAETSVLLLSAELQAVSDPTSTTILEELVGQARAAVKAAGDDPHFLAMIAVNEAAVASARGHYDEAIAKFDEAYRGELSIRNIGQATRLFTDEATTILRRDRPGDVATAWKRLTEAIDRATQMKREDSAVGAAGVARYVAQVRGDFVAMHAMADFRTSKPKPPDGAGSITGRVVDASGAPVAGATVVAWTGELVGDAKRAYSDPRFVGDIATTGVDGAFSVRGVRSGGIIAEHGDRRSPPRVIGTGDVVLALAPTRTIATKVASDDEVLTGIIAYAHFPLAKDLAWELGTVVARTHELSIAGVPQGAATLRLANGLDPNQPLRTLDFGPVDTAAPKWPTGPGLDVIVRGLHDATIFVLRDRVAAKTRADLERLFETGNDVVEHPALVIGIGDETTEGVKLYQRGDQHAVLLSNRPGLVTICAAEAANDAAAVCKQVEIPNSTPPIVDGRGLYPTIPVVVQR